MAKIINQSVLKIDNHNEDILLQEAQKIFNQLINDIAKKHQNLKDLDAAIAKFRIGYFEKIIPLESKRTNLLKNLIPLIDANFDDRIFNNSDRKKMCDIIEELMSGFDDKYIDDELKDIFARRVGVNFDFYIKNMKTENLDMLADAAMGSSIHKEHKKTKRKKSVVIPEENEDAKNKSLKDIYRQLAKELHPDRLSHDEDGIYKSELMKQVNVAYEKQDLITLLEVQLKIEQADQKDINSLAFEKLQHFNAILKKQLSEADNELNSLTKNFSAEFPYFDHYMLNAKKILKELKSNVTNAKLMLEMLEVQFLRWSTDFSSFREYLRQTA
ncbi:MAG: J domain-containing protein [Burkholderiales bacterium]|nr:J domain-containing protein [Burkholderiales bacterium]